MKDILKRLEFLIDQCCYFDCYIIYHINRIPDRGIFAAKPHTDYGAITILANDQVDGLQILHENQWKSVPPVEGAFVVNLGDMLQKWTNGLYKSTMHRVVMDGEEDRYSIPFFFEPNVHCRVKPVVVREGEGVREEEIVSQRI